MNERNNPRNLQGKPHPKGSAQSSPETSSEAASRETNSSSVPSQKSAQQQSSSVPGWQTVEFPSALSADANQRQSLYTQSMARKTASSNKKTVGSVGTNPEAQSEAQSKYRSTHRSKFNHAVRSPASHSKQSSKQSDHQSAPSAEALIALIQDTNQRNHELMNRVTELEEALEQSRQALQAELDRSTDDGTSTDSESSHSEASRTEASRTEVNSTNSGEQTDPEQQVRYLLTQLEFTQQANQRQEILVETLTGQLQSSQERVTQLEQEYQHLQQTVFTQTAQIEQWESQCHDLQARLYRQQQYTLQFKAALDKCLEVPPPSYETVASEVVDKRVQDEASPSSELISEEFASGESTDRKSVV